MFLGGLRTVSPSHFLSTQLELGPRTFQTSLYSHSQMYIEPQGPIWAPDPLTFLLNSPQTSSAPAHCPPAWVGTGSASFLQLPVALAPPLVLKGQLPTEGERGQDRSWSESRTGLVSPRRIWDGAGCTWDQGLGRWLFGFRDISPASHSARGLISSPRILE